MKCLLKKRGYSLNFILLVSLLPIKIWAGGKNLPLWYDVDASSNSIIGSLTCNHCNSFAAKANQYKEYFASDSEYAVPKLLILSNPGEEHLTKTVIQILNSEELSEESFQFLFEFLEDQSVNGSSLDETIGVLNEMFPNSQTISAKTLEIFENQQNYLHKLKIKTVPSLLCKSFVMSDFSLYDIFNPSTKQSFLVPDPYVLDLGKLEEGKPVSYKFSLTNNGNGPAFLNDSSIAFPGSTLKFSKEILAPGEKTEVELSWVPDNYFTGRVDFEAQYRSVANKDSFTIKIKAERDINDWSLFLDDIYISVDKLLRSEVVLTSSIARNLSNIRFSDNIPFFEIVPEQTGNQSFVIKFKQTSDDSVQLLKDELKVVTTRFKVFAEEEERSTSFDIYILKPQEHLVIKPTIQDIKK